jgi:3-hydroxyisobutyrate dehydrogenase-like beta-hydroxyacid dehydrogenase
MARIAFLGLGVIGRPMAERLLESAHQVVVWNRTAEKTRPLVELGARIAATPRAAAEAAEIVVTMLTDGPAVIETVERADGLLAGLVPGKVHCDMSTIDIASSRRLADLYRSRSIGFVRAPVLGNRHAAREGRLLIFAGGPEDALTRAGPVFTTLGERVWHWDGAEQATAMKLASNLLLGGMMEIFAETLVFAASAGIAPRTVLEVIAASALAAPMYQSKGRMILEGGTPNFYVRNMRKDLDLIVASGRELHAPLPGTQAVRDAFVAAEPGRADRDYSAVIEWLEEQAGVHVSGTGGGSAAGSGTGKRSS